VSFSTFVRGPTLRASSTFIAAAADDEVPFDVKVTKIWLRHVIVALALVYRGS
jgi:hypothetical protein